MLCPVLISRDKELKQLISALEDAGRREGSITFLTGDPGVGKTRLAKEVAEAAQFRGFHVVTGRAVESAARLPYRPITEALMKIARSEGIPHAREITDYRPALATLVPIWGESSSPGQAAEVSPLILGEAMIRLLSLCGGAGTMLLLEDIHWADPETLAIVQYLADNLAGKRILCVATLRDSEPSAGLDTVRSIHARRAAPVIELPRLTEHEIEQLAACCLDVGEVPKALTRRLLGGCDGLPFAVEEILAAAASSGEITKSPAGWQVNESITTGVPDSILSSVRNRLAALGPQVTDLIVAAAVLGRKFDWRLLSKLSGVTETEALAALDQAHAVQLIELCPNTGLFRFRHSLTRDAIVSDLLPPDLAARSARAAAVIEDTYPGLPGTWCERAAELHKAAGNTERAASLLLESGRRALRQGAIGSAAQALAKAREVAADRPASEPMLGVAIDESMVEALELAGDRSRLVPLAAKLIRKLEAAGADPRRAAMVRIRAARAEAEHDPQAFAAHLAAARGIADRLHDPALSSRIDAAAAKCALVSRDFDQAELLAKQSLATAEDAGLDGWAADVAFEALEVIGCRERARDIGAARAAFSRAYDMATGPDFTIRRIRALHELGSTDMLADGSPDRLNEARELAHRAGAISTVTVADLQLANVWSMGADLDLAMRSARQSEQSARRINARKLEALAVSTQALISGIRRDREAAVATAERAEAIMPGEPEVLFTTWGQARVTASLFDDDIAGAYAESVVARAHAGNAALTAPRRAWGFYALLQAITGHDGPNAIQQARDAGADLGWIRGCLRYAEAVTEGKEGNAGRASELAEQGQALLEPYAPWWNHLIMRLVAEAAFTDGWGAPADWLREATAEFEATGQAKLATACRTILRRAGERVPRSGRGNAKVPAQMRRLGITSREMDVYLLVADGLSNVEIATRLFISPKTVETHVASLVNKTGQPGRRELVAHAARSGPPLNSGFNRP
jgi:DNA-binding CsgD family transcriptional regulator